MNDRGLIRACSAVAALWLAGCGGAPVAPEQDGIDAVRRAAQERPGDPLAQARWAEAELFMPGGDAAAAERAIAGAIRLDPENARLQLLHGLERHLHGDADVALQAYLRAIALATTSRDPLAPAVAEVAVSYLAELDDGVPEFARRIEEALAPVFAEPGRIGPGARHPIGVLLMELAYRRGEPERVRAIAAAQGCAAEFRVAGPFGPRVMLGVDRPFAPEEPGPLSDAYDLGPGRGVRATRTLQPRGCTLHLGNGPVSGPGTTYAEAEFAVPAEGDYLLRLESPNSVEAFVDDRSVARVDRRVASLPRVTFLPIHLAAGTHRLMVKTVSRHPNPVLVVSLIRPDGRAASEGPMREAIEGLDAELTDGSPFEIALSAARHIARSDFVRARETIRPLAQDEGATSAALLLASIAALSDPLAGEQVAADEARRLLVRMADRDPRAWYPRLQLANLEPDELTRIRMLRAAVEAWPEMIVLPLSLVDRLEARGWDAAADEAIAAALRAVPDACRPRRAMLHAALRRSRMDEVGRLADELVACDARSDARLQHAVRQRRWDDAMAEVRRIAALEPPSARHAQLDAELTLARARGDGARAEQLLAELSVLMPRSLPIVTMQADRLLASGDGQRAVERLMQGLREGPDEAGALHRLVRILGGEDPLRPFRLDGPQVIREFEQSGRTYDGPKVLVLDYTVVYVFEDRSSLELTHNIIRIQSEEAIDQEGEVRVPEGAQLLTLRTVKADGRRLEPDEIEGKDTISMPNLAVGDYVEIEYVRFHPAPAGYPNGTVGDRFYFQSFEVPFDRSELTVSLPPDVEPIVETRGRDAPRTEQSLENGRRVLRWRVRQSRALAAEPGSVSAREFLPSVYWGYGASWQDYVESLRDVLADRDVRDPAHERLVREIVGDERSSPEAIARRLYHWVLENVEDDDDAFGQAATMLHARRGSRVRVLHYLLGIAGIPSELAIARSFAHDLTPAQLPDEETFRFLVLRMQGSTGPLWIWAGARGAPFGFLPIEPMIRGQEALVLNERAERVRLDDPPPQTDAVDVEMDVRFDGEGGARFDVVETHTGANAVAWRAQLENVPAAQLEDAFARRYVAQLASGARMTDLTITGREDAEQPLVLRYAFEVRRFGRLQGDAHLVPQLHRVALARNYARLTRRTTTQVLAGGARRVTMRVHLPAGGRVDALPAQRDFTGPHGMRGSLTASADGDRVTITRTLVMPRARIAPDEYESFARFCRAFDEAEDLELRIEL